MHTLTHTHTSSFFDDPLQTKIKKCLTILSRAKLIAIFLNVFLINSPGPWKLQKIQTQLLTLSLFCMEASPRGAEKGWQIHMFTQRPHEQFKFGRILNTSCAVGILAPGSFIRDNREGHLNSVFPTSQRVPFLCLFLM